MSGLVKEWKKPKRPEDRGSYWFSPANHLDWKGPFRNPGIWLHHLYSKIRGHSSGGNGSASSFADTANVPGADVLVRTRHLGWWNYNGRRHRRTFCASRLISIIALLFFSQSAAKVSGPLWKSDTLRPAFCFQQGYIDQPLPLAEAGYKESAGYPDLNWKFRVLTAEARNRKKQYRRGAGTSGT